MFSCGDFWRGSPLLAGRQTFRCRRLHRGNSLPHQRELCPPNGHPIASSLRNPDIWVLADQKLVGAPRQPGAHRWQVVVTSSPREEKYHYLVKESSPKKFYHPTWDWGELWQLRKSCLPRWRTSCALAVEPASSSFAVLLYNQEISATATKIDGKSTTRSKASKKTILCTNLIDLR